MNVECYLLLRVISEKQILIAYSTVRRVSSRIQQKTVKTTRGYFIHILLAAKICCKN